MWSNHPDNDVLPGGLPDSDAEKVPATARFDEEAIRQARPAVPLSSLVAHKVNPKVLIVAVLIAGLIGSVIGGVLSVRYFNSAAEPEADVAKLPQAATPAERLPADGKPADEKDAAPKSSAAEPVSETVAKSDQSIQQDHKQTHQEVNTPTAEAQSSSEEDTEPDTKNRTAASLELRQAFNTWLKANKEGDVDRQMGFYHSQVNAFYLKRGVTPATVRAEKDRVLGRANSIQIEAGEPEIKISPDGQQAIIRYRKRYRIEMDDGNRTGEVLQELRWQRVDSKWRIVSERDMKVLR